MKIFFNCVSLLLLSFAALAQAGFSKGSGMVFQPVPNGFVTQLPPAPSRVLGNYYLNDDWRVGKIYLSDNQTIEGVPIRYEAKLNQFEIKADAMIKVLDGTRVLFFSWLDSRTGMEENYLSLRDYKLNGSSVVGFARVVSDGEKFKMLCVTRFSESLPTYNVAMDVGNRNTVVKKESAYCLGKNTELIALAGGKRKVINTVKSFTEKDVTTFVKGRSLNFRSENDFAILTQELNR